jgi:flagellar basal-body rod protein FlgB
MESQKLFGKTMMVVEQALNVRARNHSVIVSNISNADTPNYKAFHLEVDKAMEKFAAKSNRLNLRCTQKAHLPFQPGPDFRSSIKVNDRDSFTLRGDGNTVDMDKEMANLGENSLMYNASAQIIQKQFQSLKSVIQGGNGGR